MKVQTYNGSGRATVFRFLRHVRKSTGAASALDSAFDAIERDVIAPLEPAAAERFYEHLLALLMIAYDAGDNDSERFHVSLHDEERKRRRFHSIIGGRMSGKTRRERPQWPRKKAEQILKDVLAKTPGARSGDIVRVIRKNLGASAPTDVTLYKFVSEFSNNL